MAIHSPGELCGSRVPRAACLHSRDSSVHCGATKQRTVF